MHVPVLLYFVEILLLAYTKVEIESTEFLYAHVYIVLKKK